MIFKSRSIPSEKSSPTSQPTGLETLEPRMLLSGTLCAEFVSVDNTSALTGFKTADLQVTSTTDWTAAALLIELTQGSIYQEQEGTLFNGSTLGPPRPALFGIYPTSEFDTYVQSNGNPVSFVGAAGDVGGDALQFDTVQIDASWSDLATNDIGTFNIGRFTLSDDAVGTWALFIVSAGGNTFSDSGSITTGDLATPPPTTAVDGDFTGDGKADIFWRNTVDGRNAVWQLDGTTFQLETAVKRLKNTKWKLVGTGDFTGDGKNDLLWRNTTDGRNTVWEMDNTTFQRAIPLKAQTDLNWQVGGVGDLTADGKPDIFWRNTLTGKNAIWEMNDTTFQSQTAVRRVRNLDWQAAAVGDLTGDGKADILWRNSVTGKNTVWEMNDTTFQSNIAIKRVKNLAWKIAGIADYTGDGIADILWHRIDTGANTVWRMNLTTLQVGIPLPAEPNLDKKPASPLLGLWEV